ncbi:venom allergen 5.01-like [Cimex lectularius]|uniref:Uncharacterized protein n=1 Tax=Cimex lectularius TaxID=79782 RepID=A0A8I6RJX3_CIMLE|nr:venom allergen 5.01-like [Cimex lectularius]
MEILTSIISTFFLFLFTHECNGKYIMPWTYCCGFNGKDHLLCKYGWNRPKPNCVNFKKHMTRKENMKIVGIINQFRDRAAEGKLTNFPNASKMYRIKGNIELRLLAEAVSFHCNLSANFNDFQLYSIYFNTSWIYLDSKMSIGSRTPKPSEMLNEMIKNVSLNLHTIKALNKNGYKTMQRYPVLGFLWDFFLYIGCTSTSFQGNDHKYFTLICVLGPKVGDMDQDIPYATGKPRSGCDPSVSTFLDKRYPHLCSSALRSSRFCLWHFLPFLILELFYVFNSLSHFFLFSAENNMYS